MIGARLPLAMAAGWPVPEGARVVVVHPAAGADLSAVGACDVVTPIKPVFDEFAAAGHACSVTFEARYGAAVVCVPRAKAEARALIAAACAATDGPVMIDGQKTDGIDSILKDLRKRGAVSAAISKAHGKAFWIDGGGGSGGGMDLSDWAQGPALTAGGFWTAPGVFSADGIDPASEMLAAVLPDKLGKQVVDLGAGWGFLSAHVLTRDSVEAVHLVEAHHMAVECARRNVTDPRAVFHWADATVWRAPGRVDTVVMNPPFHTARAASPELGQAFIAAAARVLAPSGSLWMVANRHLPYEGALDAHFARIEEVGGDARFKLSHASRPKRRK